MTTEIIGTIDNLTYTNGVYYIVILSPSNKKYNVVTKISLPYEKEDSIFCVCKDATPYSMIKHPLVNVSKTEESLKKILYSVFQKNALLVYHKLTDNQTVEQTFNDLIELCCKFKRNDSMENPFEWMDTFKYTTLMDTIFASKILRQLKLLGMEPNEYLEYRSSKDFFTDLMENPYKVYTIPLEKADHVSNILNVEPSTDTRKCGAVVREIYKYIKSKGHVGIKQDFAYNHFSITPSQSEILKSKFEVTEYLNTMYLNYFFQAETLLSNRLKPQDQVFPNLKISDSLSEDQIIAVNGALNNKISIITGSAGTGKTTVIKELVRVLTIAGLTYVVCSFTGKAVSRIQELKIEAFTIHRLINKCVNADVLIIDEVSMVSNDLLYLLLKTNSYYKIILIGDYNQLSPIDWGDLLAELMKCVPTYTLTVQHRQNFLDIIDNLGRVLNKNMVIPSENFLLEPKLIDEQLITHRSDIQNFIVITPLNIDVKSINERLQALFLNETDINSIYDESNRKFMVGDKVMSTSNDYQKDVFNGDEGIVVSVKPFTVHYNRINKDVKYDIKKLYKITHSWCITVHRSQGSEWKTVYFVLKDFSSFVTNNMIYTALSRAKEKVYFICSNTDVIEKCIKNIPPKRLDNLSKRITN